jgi:hypothetical protein
MPVRIPLVLLVLAVGLTLGLVGVATVSERPGEVRAPGRPPAASRPATEHAALAVLHAWDHRRGEAWAAGDAAALARLYTARSAAGAADVALLRRYVARGLVVRDLRMQLLRARVLVHRPRLLELEVTDRLAAGRAARPGDPGAARPLPADVASTTVLTLRRVGDRWLMARVSAAGGR